MDASRFVFLDETGTTTDMARRYGRSPCGARLVGKAAARIKDELWQAIGRRLATVPSTE